MKKKTIVWAYLLVLSLGTILSLYIPKNEVAAKDAIVIPGQAIRLRILANSDLSADQELKRQVRDKVNAKISVWVKDLTSMKAARKVIQSKLPEIETTAEEVVKEHGSEQTVKVKFGKVPFPTKLYGQFLYPAGNYEAVLITLGEGKGTNWWCVLFPPLCFLDFSNGVAVSNGFEEQKSGTGKKSEPFANASEEASKEIVESHPAQRPMKEPAAEREDQAKVKQDRAEADQNQAKVKQKSINPQRESAAAKLESSKPEQSISKSDQSVPVSAKADLPEEKSDTQKQAKAKTTSKQHKPEAPVYTSEDEQPIKVKFFALELWNKLF